MLNYKFIHKYSSAVVTLSADSSEEAVTNLKEIVISPNEFYEEEHDEDDDFGEQGW
jgi:hypothetical protein